MPQDFIFNAGDPGSYPAMEMRRRIALQMLSKRRGYPKNIGEGLTAIGDSLGDIGTMQALARQEAAYQKKIEQAAKDAENPPTTTTEPPATTEPPPAKTSSADEPPPATHTALSSGIVPDTSSFVPQDEPLTATDVATAPAEPPAPTEARTLAADASSQLPATFDDRFAAATPAARPPVQPPATDSELYTEKAQPPSVLASAPMSAPLQGGSFPDARHVTSTAETLPPVAAAPHKVATAPSATTGDPYDRYGRAISGIESGGARDPYTLVGARTRTGDRAYGKYQVMGENVPEWTQAALGQRMTPQDFLHNPKAQEAVFRHQFGQYVDKYGPEGAAKAWFGGETGMHNPNATDVHGRLTVASYGRDFTRRMGGDSGSEVASSPREAIAAKLASSNAPLTSSDLAQEATLSDVTGMGSGDRGYSYPQTASLGREGDVQSDAPEAGIVGAQTGNAIADTVQQRQQALRNGVTNSIMKQQQPQQPEMLPPVTVSPPGTTGAVQPPPGQGQGGVVSDIQPAPAAGDQFAQARTSQQLPAQTPPPPPARPGAGAPIEEPVNLDKTRPPEPPKPGIPDKTPRQIYNENMYSRAVAEGDPQKAALHKSWVDKEEAARQQKYNDALKLWEPRYRHWEAQDSAWEAAQRGMKKNQADLATAQAQATSAAVGAQITARTGMSPEAFTTKMDKLKETAIRDANILKESRLAREAIAMGIVSGVGGTFKLNADKVLAHFGNMPAAERAARSEQYLAAVNSTIGNALANIQPGDTKVTEGDMRMASGTIGADLSLQRATQEKLVEQTIEAVNRRINTYEDTKDRYLKGLPMEHMYDVPFPSINDRPDIAKGYIDRLLEHKGDYDARKAFDDRFGKGAAELEIRRAERRDRKD